MPTPQHRYYQGLVGVVLNFRFDIPWNKIHFEETLNTTNHGIRGLRPDVLVRSNKLTGAFAVEIELDSSRIPDKMRRYTLLHYPVIFIEPTTDILSPATLIAHDIETQLKDFIKSVSHQEKRNKYQRQKYARTRPDRYRRHCREYAPKEEIE